MKNRRIFFLVLLSLISLCPLISQGYPVIDVANLFQAIDTLYATYDQITATIEQVQNTYQQLQKQIAMVENMNWDNLEESLGDIDLTSIEGIYNLRDNLKDVTKAVNSNLQLITDVQDTLTKKTVSFAGKNYSVGGLFGFGNTSGGTTIFDLPKTIVDYVTETAEETVAGYAGKLTYRQKEAIMRRYGMSPANYAKIKLVEEQGNGLIQDMLTTGTGESVTAVTTQAVENQKAIMELTNAAGESMVKQQQATTTALLNVAGGLTRLEAGLGRLQGYLGNKEISERIEKEVAAEAKEIIETQLENQSIKRSGLPAGF